jgi:hypothetical protein
MTRDDIIAMAQEAGFKRHHNPDLYDCMVASDEAIERFAAIVEDAQSKRMFEEGMVTVGHMRQQIAAEREANSKARAGKPRQLPRLGTGALQGEQQCCFEMGWKEGAAAIRAAIRARGQA